VLFQTINKEKKMQKKLFGLLSVLILVSMMLAACGCGLKFRGNRALKEGFAVFEIFPRIGFWLFGVQGSIQ